MKFFLQILFLLLLVSCAKKETTKPAELHGPEYYPLKQGRFAIFECDSTVFTEIPRDTLHYHYQVKEVLSGTFTDDAGQEAWKLERYLRWYQPGKSVDSLPWVIKDVWQVNADKRSLQIVEENHRYTKLSYPVKQGATWNGNAWNTEGESQYVYEYIDQKETIGAQTFDRTLKVVQLDFRTLISYENSTEKYAAGVGLVYRNFTEIFSNNIVPGQAVEQRIEKGVMFTQTLIAHGYQ